MADQTTARDRAIEMAQRLEWAVAEEPGYGFLLRTVREAAPVLREAADAPPADVADELKQLRERERLLRFYLAKLSGTLGRPTTLALDNVYDIERVGEGALAELDRQARTVNAELSAPASDGMDLEALGEATVDELAEVDRAEDAARQHVKDEES